MIPRRAASLSVSFPGLAWKANALAVVAPKAVDRGLERGIRAAALDVEGQAKKYLEGEVLNKRTGRLWRSIHSETFRRLGRVVGIVGTNVKYAAIHEFGGIIRPKSAGGLLVFQAESGGDFVFAKQVKIPRRPYLSRAFQARKAIVSRLVMRAIMEEVRGRGGLNTGGVVPASERTGVGFNAD